MVQKRYVDAATQYNTERRANLHTKEKKRRDGEHMVMERIMKAQTHQHYRSKEELYYFFLID